MSQPVLETRNLRLVCKTPAEARAMIDAMSADDKAQVSPKWLALLEHSPSPDPWVHGFSVVSRDEMAVGSAGFAAPPGPDGVVEIAYGIAPEHQGKGFATEAAQALVAYASQSGRVRVVCAHTLPESNASARVLTKCGFQNLGEVMHPEDGRVWRWEKKL